MQKVSTKRKRFSIVTRFNLMTIMLILFLSIGIGIFISRNESEEHYQQILENGKTITSMVANESEFAIYTENKSGLMQIISGLDSVPYMAYVVILKKDKSVLEKKVFIPSVLVPPLPQDNSALAKGVMAEEIVSSSTREHFFNFVSVVESNPGIGKSDFIDSPEQSSGVIGYIQIGLSQEGLQKTVRKLYITIILFTTVFTAIGVILTIIFTRKIINPLRELISATQEVAGGKMESRINITTNDEISDLTQSFNHMLDNLNIYRNQVEERTKELLNKIAERKQIEEHLRESKERYALAANGANDGLWDWNIKKNEVYYSSRWKKMLGFSDGELGNALEDWLNRVDPQERDRVRLELNNHIKGMSEHFEKEYRILHKDGTYRWMLSRGLVVRDEFGMPYRIAGSQTDITEQKKVEAQLLYGALHDSLTGLPNRALFADRLTYSFNLSRRLTPRTFGVLFCDLDRFKFVNDSLGHLIGDQLLIEVARRFEQCIRNVDTLARLGGDEFAILLSDITDVDNTKHTAERILNKFANPFFLNGQEIFMNVSIGIAIATKDSQDPQELLRDADIAMYQAKTHGKGRFEVFDSGMRAQILRKMQIDMDLRGAIDRNEFRIDYQPIIDVQTNKIYAFEALVRWQHPNHGIIPPMDFIPIAEETGLIIPLGRWIIREACCLIAEWEKKLPRNPPLLMSINISCKQLTPHIVGDIRNILKETKIQGSHLVLEITESAIMENPDLIYPLLLELTEMNISLSIDDFGTGYSSLSYLQRLPINKIKIDRSFIKELGIKTESLEIVRTIIALAHSLSIEVIAEGVETLPQLEHLKSLQCKYIQGYFYSKPLDKNAVENFLVKK